MIDPGMMGLAILRAADRAVRPWKNGGGTTQDIASFPRDAGLADFGWRLSIARVAAAGPFSSFPGVDRHLAILSGRMALDIAGQPDRNTLTADDQPVSFPGDVATVGTPLGGPVCDLNLMVRRNAFLGRLRRMDGVALTTDVETTIVVSRSAITLTVDAEDVDLLPRDGLILERGTTVRASAPILLAEIDPLQ